MSTDEVRDFVAKRTGTRPTGPLTVETTGKNVKGYTDEPPADDEAADKPSPAA